MTDGRSWAFVPGDGIALVGPRQLVLLTDRRNVGPITRLRALVLGGTAGFDDLLDVVTTGGLREMPALGLLEWHGSSLRVLVRGGVRARLRNQPEGQWQLMHGAIVTTWTESYFEHVCDVQVGLSPFADDCADDRGPDFAVTVGMVPADSLASVLDAALPPPGSDVRTDGSAHEPGTANSSLTLTHPPDSDDLTRSPAIDPAPETAVVQTLGPAPGETDGYHHLFGATLDRSVEAAAVRPEALEQGPAPEPLRDASETTTDPLVHPSTAAAASAAPGLFIEQVPWSSPMVGPDPNAEAAGDHDGLTTSSTDLRRLRSADSSPEHSDRAGQLPFVRCRAGHLNPPHAADCRACGAPVAEQETQWAQRPVIGSLTFSTGQLVQLDRSVIVGRAPHTDRHSGDDLPRLVTVPDADHEISRSHVTVRIEGWHVLVTDLSTTNGTVVTAPGAEPQRLHPGEQQLISPGAVVELSPTVSFTYQVTP